MLIGKLSLAKKGNETKKQYYQIVSLFLFRTLLGRLCFVVFVKCTTYTGTNVLTIGTTAVHLTNLSLLSAVPVLTFHSAVTASFTVPIFLMNCTAG